MFFIYFLLWVIFNGRFTLEIAVFGVAIAAAMFGFSCRFMGYSLAKERQNIKKAFQVIAFVFLLLKEITLANFAVIRLILTQKEEIVPELVSFRSDLKTPSARAFLANAITLTPGTITVTLEGDRYLVHCLDESMADGIEDLEFQRRLSRLESGSGRKEI
ncbi:MAG: Na+/H+ antiporter subunit E [Eubacterium sp.]|nr:Na+/H+ antiporter subunit E [Eubacterium sp.]MCM1214839.1 Na+/H+ antiporter subunit E [Lachnospiraceae bacterium]MCM1303466.1 Na+/H+ antiporter subunit E [Butyrivibrio sp.]MCM1342770.1 Na+/H+ antiporter subunit E [Muribaculaceae bacterium]MCM1238915.1 Na+/H+ antiporter subunit E [Lachnospiraceae bacterium]